MRPRHLRERVALPDFAGRAVTLSAGPDAWERVTAAPAGHGHDLLLLGLGPVADRDAGQPDETGQAAGRLPCAAPGQLPFVRAAQAAGGRIFWLDEPQTLAALRPGGADIPAGWRRVRMEDAAAIAASAETWFYRPGLRLAPGFWGPLLGRIDALRAVPPRRDDSRHAGQGGQSRMVWLPGDERQLLHRELVQTLMATGIARVAQGVPRQAADLTALWGGERPLFALSVNLRGLDAEGRIFHCCRALGVPVALWLVDNPWQLLSAARLPWWRETALFVTDASFIPSLRAAGAACVQHLPLAVAPHMWRPLPDAAEAASLARLPPRFVGRSSFPGRERFFAAARVPGALAAEARCRLEASWLPEDAPHFHWWTQRLRPRLWPGCEARSAGLGAERCGRANRARWLAAALPAGLAVTGDAAWRELVPGCAPEAPVDYYGHLPDLYRGAAAILNVTSLLLPHSLNQRHFDVWAAGGLVLTDATPGLELFPARLTRAIRLSGPADLAPRLAALAADPDGAVALRRAWRRHLREAHTYAHRLARIREILGV